MVPIETVIDFSESSIKEKSAVSAVWNEQANHLVEMVIKFADKTEIVLADEREVSKLKKPPFYGDMVNF